MIWNLGLLTLITLQRVAEMVWARSNEQKLLARGAIEVGARHYPLIVLLHCGWLVALWWQGWNRPLQWLFVIAFVVLQMARGWVLATLGRRWTTRVLFVPGETLVKRGPFRLVRHPNYLVVVLEMAVGPLIFGLWGTAIAFGLLNLSILSWRIYVEDRALAPLRHSK